MPDAGRDAGIRKLKAGKQPALELALTGRDAGIQKLKAAGPAVFIEGRQNFAAKGQSSGSPLQAQGVKGGRAGAALHDGTEGLA